ncbi:MAG: hypothetical protein HRU20_13495 [Pseudomonadales bacterium]|nr:hypothetical protein [Pseudomonadales bacterium]
MRRGRATCEANHGHFIKSIIANKQVLYLMHDDVAACCESYDFENAGVIFFSDEQYAKRIQRYSYKEHDIVCKQRMRLASGLLY